MTRWMDELEQLGELRDKGLITDEEFEALRIKIVPSPNEVEEWENYRRTLARQTQSEQLQREESAFFEGPIG